MSHGFGRSLTVGVEEELFLVEPATLGLLHEGSVVLQAIRAEGGSAHSEIYEACIELTSPVSTTAGEAVEAVATLRAQARAAGACLLGAGIHPSAPPGDVRIGDQERYHAVAAYLRGLVDRFVPCALHVHVGMPDEETGVRVLNALRGHLPLIEAVAANSPYWHGADSGLAACRSILNWSFPSYELPRAFGDFTDYWETVQAVCEASGADDYTYLWWEVRLHPRLGTVEIRAMDAQSSLASVAGIAALVQALAKLELERDARPLGSELIGAYRFRALRDGLDGLVPWEGGVLPAREALAAALDVVRPHASELGSDAALDELGRVLADGNGADRQRRAFANAGIRGVLELLARETAADDRRGAALVTRATE